MKCEGCKKQKRAATCQECYQVAEKMKNRMIKARSIADKRRLFAIRKLKKSERGRIAAVKEIYRIGLIVANTPRSSLSFRLRNFFGI